MAATIDLAVVFSNASGNATGKASSLAVASKDGTGAAILGTSFAAVETTPAGQTQFASYAVALTGPFDTLLANRGDGQVQVSITGHPEVPVYVESLTDHLMLLQVSLFGPQIAALLMGLNRVTATSLTARAGDTWAVAVAGLGTLVGRSKLWFTLKRFVTDADNAAVLQITETGGQVFLNGVAGTANHAWITVTDPVAGALTIGLVAADSVQIAAGRYVFDVKVLNGGVVAALAEGTLTVTADVTQATA